MSSRVDVITLIEEGLVYIFKTMLSTLFQKLSIKAEHEGDYKFSLKSHFFDLVGVVVVVVVVLTCR
jgi:hypothetical protein